LLVRIAAVLEIELWEVGADDTHAPSIAKQMGEPRRFRASGEFCRLSLGKNPRLQSHLGT
jgi:hypothetical protein